MGKRYTVEQFTKAIPGSGGIISTIAKRVGCEWNTAKSYIDKHPSVKQAYDDEREQVTDMAETALIKAIQGGDMWAVKYYLSTVGKHRGYVERQEMTGADGNAVTIRIIDETDDTAEND